MSSKEKEKKDKGIMQYSQSSQPSLGQSQPRVLPATLMPKPEANAQLVPFPGYMPIPINNRFNPLSQPSPRPNYQSVLVSQYDPFMAHPPMPSQCQSPQSQTQRSKYYPRSNSNLFSIEPYLEDLTDPVKIVKKFFPPNFHYFPSHPSKTLRFYRDILFETQSAEIRPIKDKQTDATIFIPFTYAKSLSQNIGAKMPMTSYHFNQALLIIMVTILMPLIQFYSISTRISVIHGL
ncbi:hypothetical protein ACE6H2_020190 [Prunus campanulata]